MRRLRPVICTPNDPDFPSQWALKNTGQQVGGINGTAGADINAETAWCAGGQGSTSITVAVIDSGIDYTHSELAPNVWSAPSAYTITENGTVYQCPQGSHGFDAVGGGQGCAGQEKDTSVGHGTAVAGIIGAAGGNSSEIAGVNWTTSLLSLKVVYLDGGSASWVASDVAWQQTATSEPSAARPSRRKYWLITAAAAGASALVTGIIAYKRAHIRCIDCVGVGY